MFVSAPLSTCGCTVASKGTVVEAEEVREAGECADCVRVGLREREGEGEPRAGEVNDSCSRMS